jgi:hypothetical protein
VVGNGGRAGPWLLTDLVIGLRLFTSVQLVR